MLRDAAPSGLPRTTEEMARLVEAFERGTLPPEQWTHAAHLTVALWYLSRLPEAEALRRLRSGIQAYNAARGLVSAPTGGYHETITRFYVWIVGRFLRAADPDAALPELFAGLMRDYGHKKLLAQYYSRPRLLSEEAQTGWVEPDLRSRD